MAEIIAAGTAQAFSADITVPVGGNPTFALKGLNGELPRNSVARVQLKAATGGTYMTVGQLDDTAPAKVFLGSGIVRISKEATSLAVGVDQT